MEWATLMQTADAGDVVPERYIVDFDALRGENHEIAYVKESFEILKEAASWIALALSIRQEGQSEEMPRDQAICAGQLVRMYKIMRLVLRQIADDHGGDHQMALSREFLESASTVAYLLDAPSDSGRFLSFLHDSLIQESQLLKTIEGQITQRGGEVWPIEERMRRSALNTFRHAGVEPRGSFEKEQWLATSRGAHQTFRSHRVYGLPCWLIGSTWHMVRCPAEPHPV